MMKRYSMTYNLAAMAMMAALILVMGCLGGEEETKPGRIEIKGMPKEVVEPMDGNATTVSFQVKSNMDRDATLYIDNITWTDVLLKSGSEPSVTFLGSDDGGNTYKPIEKGINRSYLPHGKITTIKVRLNNTNSTFKSGYLHFDIITVDTANHYEIKNVKMYVIFMEYQ